MNTLQYHLFADAVALIWIFYAGGAEQGVQLLLDGVVRYMPNPLEVNNYALDQHKNEEKVCEECIQSVQGFNAEDDGIGV